MRRPQLITWTTRTAESTTLLEATRLQKLYTYMCNIVTELVTEFYLYSIAYIYSINSRLDVTHSVRHHFHTIQTLSVTVRRITRFLTILWYEESSLYVAKCVSFSACAMRKCTCCVPKMFFFLDLPIMCMYMDQ